MLHIPAFFLDKEVQLLCLVYQVILMCMQRLFNIIPEYFVKSVSKSFTSLFHILKVYKPVMAEIKSLQKNY